MVTTPKMNQVMGRMIFNELDFRLSVVQRWSVLSTLRRQSVAEHCFNVVLIASRVAEYWFGVDPLSETMARIYRRASRHDWLEAVMGDPPTYTKPYIDEAGIMAVLDDDMIAGMDIGGDDPEIVRVIVKIADYIEALIFLRMEVSHGNTTVYRHIGKMESRFKKYLEANPVNNTKIDTCFALYQTLVVDVLFPENGFKAELYGFPNDD